MFPPKQKERLEYFKVSIPSKLNECEMELAKYRKEIDKFSVIRKLNFEVLHSISNGCGDIELF